MCWFACPCVKVMASISLENMMFKEKPGSSMDTGLSVRN